VESQHDLRPAMFVPLLNTVPRSAGNFFCAAFILSSQRRSAATSVGNIGRPCSADGMLQCNPDRFLSHPPAVMFSANAGPLIPDSSSRWEISIQIRLAHLRKASESDSRGSSMSP
jgi:hypothetical protein